MLLASSRRRALAAAVILAALLLLATRQIGLDRDWHAAHGNYRAQVDALLDGRLALTPHPEGLAHDLAWTETGVHQVWGLGVPAWQAPFELAGRAAGVSPAPDRVAMLAWLALMFFVLARGFRRRDHEPWWVGPGTVAIAALLPAFVALLRGRIGVYEEAAVYAYGAAMMMLGGLAGFARRPTAAGYVLLVWLAGLGGLIRPTVWFYGAATGAVATVVWLHHARARGAPALALGLALFVAGGGLLYATNAHRFGRGAEFGHRLNLHSLPGNITATRFSYPFERARLGEAAAELGGALFDRPELRRKRGFYETGLHRGEQPIPRWREYYFTTFSWPYVPVLLAGVVLAVVAWRRRGDPDRAARWLGAWALLGLLPLAVFYLWTPSLTSRYQLDLAPGLVALLAIAWRGFARWARAGVAIGALVLAWGAAIATTKAGGRPRRVDGATAADAAYRISRPMPRAHARPAGYDAGDLDWGTHSDVATTFLRCGDEAGEEVSCDAPPMPGDRRVVGRRDADGWVVVHARIPDRDAEAAEEEAAACRGEAAATATAAAAEAEGARCEGPPTIATDPAAVVEAVTAAPTPLYLNGFGWDLETRRVPVATYFFAHDPRFVEIEVEHAPEPGGGPARAIADWTKEVRVAVDLVHLAPVHAIDTARGVRLRFEPPAPLRGGLQVIFVAFGPDEHLARPASEFRLHAIRWR